MKNKKSIYEPIFKYIDDIVENGVEDNLERYCLSGIISTLIITTVYLMFPNFSNFEHIVFKITWISIWFNLYFSMKPKED